MDFEQAKKLILSHANHKLTPINNNLLKLLQIINSRHVQSLNYEDFYFVQKFLYKVEEVRNEQESNKLLEKIENDIKILSKLLEKYNHFKLVIIDELKSFNCENDEVMESISFNNFNDVIDYISKKENSKQISRISLNKYIKNGWLKTQRISQRKHIIQRKDIDEFIEKYRKKTL